MVVKIICDLCKAEKILEPGSHSTSTISYGWKWARAASFQASINILSETLCEKCRNHIEIEKHNAEVRARESLIHGN